MLLLLRRMSHSKSISESTANKKATITTGRIGQ